MLVLTQAAAGGFLADAVARVAGYSSSVALALVSVVLALVGIAASVLHLGRPLYAYRALIGVRHSWLSREVLAFGVLAALALAHVAAVISRAELAALTAALVSAASLAAVACSVMVYHVVRRPFWTASFSVPKFLGTVIVTGLAAGLFAFPTPRSLGIALAFAMLARMALDARVLTHLRDHSRTPLRRTAELLHGPLARVGKLRLILGAVGGVALPLALAISAGSVPPWIRMAIAAVGFAVVLAGELTERVLFFKAVVRPKMPGGMAA
jgi:DMSO reductase anchor subunit